MGLRITAVVVVALALALPGQNALAGREWCAVDPILQFANGTRVQWVTQFEATHESALVGPIEFRYEVPSNAGPITIHFPASSTPETVTISYSAPVWEGRGAMPVRVSILARATTSFRTVNSVRGNVARSADLSGQSNVWVRSTAKVDPKQWYALIGDTTIVSSVTVSTTATVTGP